MGITKSSLNAIQRSYGVALEEYLTSGEENSLKKGFELGKDALVEGNGIVGLVEIHNRAARAALASSGSVPKLQEAFKRCGKFLTKFLSAFEMTHDGLGESNAALRRLYEASEQEARRIAHILHNESGELLAAIHMRLSELLRQYPNDAEARIQEVRQFLLQIEQQLKQLSHELRPTILDDFGLPPAIQVLARGVMRQTGVQVSLGASDTERLPMRIETAIYRFVQEALNNVMRHAHAQRAVIRLWRAPRFVCCSVWDDGVGFDPAGLASGGEAHGLGLIVLRERLKALGGSVKIISAPRQGTEVSVSVPIEV